MVSDADIDSAACHVLAARMKLGMFDSKERNPYARISPSVIGSKDHQQVALDAARECIVLLKKSEKYASIECRQVEINCSGRY